MISIALFCSGFLIVLFSAVGFGFGWMGREYYENTIDGQKPEIIDETKEEILLKVALDIDEEVLATIGGLGTYDVLHFNKNTFLLNKVDSYVIYANGNDVLKSTFEMFALQSNLIYGLNNLK